MQRDRRIGLRVPIELFVNQYIRERPYRSLVADLSETGLRLARVALPGPGVEPAHVIGLELDLPGTGEVIWARGEVCHEVRGGVLTSSGVRFGAMAKAHARLVREFCHHRRRERLASMLDRVRRPPLPTGRSATSAVY
jgi:c-di-GMP-binding flagellar brake protein YcgR